MFKNKLIEIELKKIIKQLVKFVNNNKIYQQTKNTKLFITYGNNFGFYFCCHKVTTVD